MQSSLKLQSLVSSRRLRQVSALALLGSVALLSRPASAAVTSAAELVDAVNSGAAGATIDIAAGTFELTAPLHPKVGMKLKGAGMGKTILRNAASWAPGNAGLDGDGGATRSSIDCSKYLFDLGEGTTDLVISDLTLSGPTLHGAICGVTPNNLELTRIEFKTFLWAGLRTFIMTGAKIHDNVFFDAGNKANVTSGSSGGALYLTYADGIDISGNRFGRSAGIDGYGIKGRELRNAHIHGNTIDTDFSIELPFEGDHTVEIDHNYLAGTISIPKWGGGPVPKGGYTFHVHHNYLKSTYSFEYQRNGVEIDSNLFDFRVEQDYGNLISSFDSVTAAPGGTKMHDNLIRNPGRGLYWNEGVYNNFAFYNNHVKGDTTVTPRTDGLFEFRPARNGDSTNWSTIVIRDNIIELTGTQRPLMRNDEGHSAVVENNLFTGVSDASAYGNADTGKPRGPLTPLCFRVGVQDEWTIDGFTFSKTPSPVPGGACGPGAGTGTSQGGVGQGAVGQGASSQGGVGGNAQGGTSQGPGPGSTGGNAGAGAGAGAGVTGSSQNDTSSSDSGCTCSALGNGSGRSAGHLATLLLGGLGLLFSRRGRSA